MNIESFSGKFRFLSNFYSVDIIYDGVKYPSVENAYQAAKWSPATRPIILQTCSASRAKQIGQNAPLSEDWEERKLGIMEGFLRQKFRTCKSLLLDTGSGDLIEGNTWGDKYWGAVLQEDGRYVGANHLGRLLMKIRSEIASEIFSNITSRHETIRHLLVCLMEECGEIVQSASKSIRFGFHDDYYKDGKTPLVNLATELDDLIAIRDMLIENGVALSSDPARLKAKHEKLSAMMEYSRKVVTL